MSVTVKFMIIAGLLNLLWGFSSEQAATMLRDKRHHWTWVSSTMMVVLDGVWGAIIGMILASFVEH